MKYKNTWDMDIVFNGGSDSTEFHNKVNELEAIINAYGSLVRVWTIEKDNKQFNHLSKIIKENEKISKGVSEARTFMSGLASADTTDTKAQTNLNLVSNLSKDLSNINIVLQKKIASLTDVDFEELISIEPFKTSSFALSEMREHAKKLLSTEEEELRNNLAIDGLHGWGDMYNELVSTVQIPLKEDGKINIYSAGQFENKMGSENDSTKRAEMLKIWEDTWESKANLFSSTLNHLSGFRLADQKAHGISNYMEPPLESNRMKKETLDAMWDTISKNKGKIVKYFDRKAKLMNVEKLGWLDVTASVSVGNFEAKKYSFSEAADFIIENFQSFSPKMADMSQKAFDERWIEAEDRPGKRPGGYCANLPESEQSRIFMTFSGSSDNVSTLAHELGHAFHSSVLRDLPLLNQRYAMNVAETASTLAELVVSDATIESASSEAEKITLLDEKIARGAVMMMNIHARYIFEYNFYKERENGIVSAERLSELMLEAQKEAYEDALSSYHPMFWAAKLHFYSTGVSFYNFPYTFGYFFSLGIYARALESDVPFEDDYIALLRDTANMTTEKLALKHLNVELTKADFWQDAINLVHSDIDEFITLTEKYI